jgi:hypothetical protein
VRVSVLREASLRLKRAAGLAEGEGAASAALPDDALQAPESN